MIELLPLWMIVALMVLLFSGYPVALVLLGVTAVSAAIAIWAGEMNLAMVHAFSFRVYGLLANNLIFPAVPPLIFMGVALAQGGLSRDLFVTLAHWLRNVPGGLPIAVLVIGVLLAPSAGLIGAAVSVITLAALPTMLERRYDPAVATSSIAAAGTLGVILPPAVMLFFLADFVGTTILSTFAGILGPAALLLLLYMVYFAINGRAKAGRVVTTGNDELPKGSGWRLIGIVAVVGSVLGAIATGFATPSQSGSCGALAAFMLLVLTGELTGARLKEILVETAYITAMVFLIIIAANAFSLVFRVLDGDAMVGRFLGSLGLGDWGTLLFILAVIFLLGFFIDWLEIVLISLPIFIPIIEKLDFTAHVGSPILVKVWLGAAIAIVLQTSFLTPPFGFALFFLRGAAPPEVRMADIYRGAVPIVMIQLIVLAVLLVLPRLATGLASLTLD